MVTSSNGAGGHLSNGDGDGLTLGGDEHNLSADLNATFVAQNAGEHKLSAVADSVDRSVLDNNARHADKKDFQRHDDATEVLLTVVLLVVPLSVLHVVHRDHGGVLHQRAGADTAELLHVSSTAEQVTEMHAKGTDVGASFAVNPHDTHVTSFVVLNELQLVDGANSELLLDSRDQGRALEASSGEGVEGLLKLLGLVELGVQLEDSNVFLAGALLGLDEAGGVVDAGDQAASDFGVEGARVASLLNLKDLLHPGNDLVGGGVGGLVQVDDSVVLEHVDGPVGGRIAAREGREVGGLDVEFVEVLKRVRIV